MPVANLIIPPWLKFECIGCGLCCRRGWIIHFSEEHYQRLKSHNWQAEYPELASQPLFAKTGRYWRFAVDDEGACGFLDARQRCLIHNDLGYDAKVLACRLYPVTFTHTNGEIRAGLHFSCPAVVKGSGSPLTVQQAMLRKLLASVQEEQGLELKSEESPSFDSHQNIDWHRLVTLETVLDHALADSETPLIRRIIHAGVLLDSLEDHYHADVEDPDFDHLIEQCNRKARDEGLNCGLKTAKLGPLERLMFRLLAGLSTEMAVPGLLSRSFLRRQRARLHRLVLAFRFFLASGSYEVAEQRGRFSEISGVRAYPLSPECEELLSRYLRTRLATRTYFGNEGWGMDVLHGARLLLSLHSVCIWLARMIAAAQNRSSLEMTDMEQAVMLCDHTFGHMSSLKLGPVPKMLNVINRRSWPQRTALYATLA